MPILTCNDCRFFNRSRSECWAEPPKIVLDWSQTDSELKLVNYIYAYRRPSVQSIDQECGLFAEHLDQYQIPEATGKSGSKLEAGPKEPKSLFILQAGGWYYSRSGQLVGPLKDRGPEREYRFEALIKNSEGKESIESWTESGRWYTIYEHGNDLVRAVDSSPEPQKDPEPRDFDDEIPF